MLGTLLRNLKIGTKFNGLLILVFIAGSVLSGFALEIVLTQNAEAAIVEESTAMMEMVEATRRYSLEHTMPLLKPRLDTELRFVQEVVPSFAASSVFEQFRKVEAYKNFAYKDAMLVPTNLKHKADSFETQLIEKFKQQPNLKQTSGFLPGFDKKLFYVTRPLVITNQSCLQCHSTPDQAPKSQIRDYGSENGFNWKLNEVLGVKVMYVPAERVFANGQRISSIVMSIVLSVFAAVLIVINVLLKTTVIQRIKNIARTAQKVSLGDMDASFQENSNDEIGTLATAFERMKTSFGLAMKFLNNQQQS
jgi:HAMP domain-containing protein